MNFKKILCPVDYSDFNQAANEYASILASTTGAEILYLFVAPQEVPYGAYAYVNREEELAAERQRLEAFKPARPNVTATYSVTIGSPAECIVDFAKQNDVDLIVLGTHGRTGLARVIMGSVAESVVRKAECPVLALKSHVAVPEPG